MGFRINTNVAALNAKANADLNSKSLDASLSRLSSGLRINSAADDASGMAIADSLRSQANTLGQLYYGRCLGSYNCCKAMSLLLLKSTFVPKVHRYKILFH